MNTGSSIKKILNTYTEKEFTKVHLNILNALLPNKMTNKEIDVLVEFINLESTIIKIDGVFGSSSKKVVRKSLSMSSSQLNNIIKSLTDKKMIYLDKGNLAIRSYLNIKPIRGNEPYNIIYNFKLELNDEENTK